MDAEGTEVEMSSVRFTTSAQRSTLSTMTALRILLCSLLAAVTAAGQTYPNRWVYVSRNFQRDSDVDDLRRIAETAAAHGLNGILLAGAFDAMDRHNEAYFRRLSEVKQMVGKLSLEIVPLFNSPGYAGGMLSYNRNLAAGLPVHTEYLAGKQEARLAADSTAAIVNGGFEDSAGNKANGYNFNDSPGVISFVDREVRHGGNASLRFENFGANPHGHGRVMQEVAVKPNRSYRVTLWVKSDNLQPVSGFQVQVLTTGGRALAPLKPKLDSTMEWRKLTLGFNSVSNTKVRIYAGMWGGRGGKLWLDDFSVAEVGLVNVLRREGTPVRVANESGGTVYEEGRDYAPIADPLLNFRFDHDGPAIRIPAGSRIQEGARLRVSYYHGIAINDGQVGACMSEPELLEIVRRNVALIQRHLAPKQWLMSIDEIRAGGSCEACKRRKLTMGQILGDYVTQSFQAIRKVNPKAAVWAWSDMLDPNHNAHGDYYLVDGDFSGSWKHIPTDLGIVCWYYEKRLVSLPFFSKLGFRTLAGAYYDGDTLENPKGWLEVLSQTPGASGIMYTTWRNKYELLGGFGDLVSGGGRR